MQLLDFVYFQGLKVGAPRPPDSSAHYTILYRPETEIFQNWKSPYQKFHVPPQFARLIYFPSAMTKSSPVVVHGGFLSKKGTGILKRGLAGRTNWKTRFFVLFYTDQARTRAGLNYYDSAPKDSFGGRVLSSVPPSPLGTINLCHLSKVATVVNPSHKEKFCFEITVNDSTGGDDDAMNLAALESKFTPEVSWSCVCNLCSDS
jgi:hypothetical protein